MNAFAKKGFFLKASFHSSRIYSSHSNYTEQKLQRQTKLPYVYRSVCIFVDDELTTLMVISGMSKYCNAFLIWMMLFLLLPFNESKVIIIYSLEDTLTKTFTHQWGYLLHGMIIRSYFKKLLLMLSKYFFIGISVTIFIET